MVLFGWTVFCLFAVVGPHMQRRFGTPNTVGRENFLKLYERITQNNLQYSCLCSYFVDALLLPLFKNFYFLRNTNHGTFASNFLLLKADHNFDLILLVSTDIENSQVVSFHQYEICHCNVLLQYGYWTLLVTL